MTLLCQSVLIIKFKKVEIISCIFSIHNGMKLEISQKKKTGKDIVS